MDLESLLTATFNSAVVGTDHVFFFFFCAPRSGVAKTKSIDNVLKTCTGYKFRGIFVLTLTSAPII